MFKKKNILNNRIVYIIILVALSRVFMYLIYQIYAYYSGDTRDFVFGLTSPWDNGWYRSIIENGYEIEPSGHPKGDAAAWAFFPLDPLCIYFFVKLFRLSVFLSGFFVNTIFLVVGLIFSDKYIMCTRKSEKMSNMFIWLMAFGPYTFYFSTLYTESLYFMLTMMTFYFMVKNDWVKMGITGALLSATRSTGVLVVFSIAIFYLISQYKQKKKWSTVFADALGDKNLVIGVSMIPIGLFAYMSYLKRLTGDSLAFLRIQKAWMRIKIPFLELVKQYLFSGDISKVYFLFFTIFSICIMIYAIYKHKSYEIVTPVVILGIQCQNSFLCIPRYMISAGLFWILVVECIVEHCEKLIQKILLLILATVSVLFLILWYQENFFCA